MTMHEIFEFITKVWFIFICACVNKNEINCEMKFDVKIRSIFLRYISN